MAKSKKMHILDKNQTQKQSNKGGLGKFHIEFKNEMQKEAWYAFQDNDVLFLSGVAGVGKSYLAMAFAIGEVLQNKKSKIILTRPVVEAGEKLGFLPGILEEKIAPYMTPLFDCLTRLVGEKNEKNYQRNMVEEAIEVAPIAYMRGRTFSNAVCIFDEAQNASLMQLKLFLTRFGDNSKVIVTGDPLQSDLPEKDRGAFNDTMTRLEGLPGVDIIRFDSSGIVRHPLISGILERLEH